MQRDIHIRDLGLHQLERADGFAELLAFAKIGYHAIKARLHNAQLQSGEHHALIIKAGHQNADPAVQWPHDALFGDMAIVKHQLCCGRAAHAHFLDLLPDGKARIILLDQKRGDALAARAAIGLGIDHEGISIRRIGDPEFGAVENISALHGVSFQFHRDDIGTSARLRHRE